MSELSPCPHCGGKADFTNRDDNWHQVICGACGCRGNEFPGSAEDARPKAAASWNARLAAQQDGGWQPIETAPKGEIVLVSGMTRLADDTLVGPNVSMAEQHEDGIWSADDYDQEALDPQPTHWMPLPAPRRT